MPVRAGAAVAAVAALALAVRALRVWLGMRPWLWPLVTREANKVDMPPGKDHANKDTSRSWRLGHQKPFTHAAFSAESAMWAAAFEPRPSDVFILTAPKTGTTWLQMLCHTLRTSGLHTEFEDIYQVAPWDQLAWDLGQDLDAEQVAKPRLFKTHLRFLIETNVYYTML